MIRVGLDVGGTFTDVVTIEEATGATKWLKVPTNVDDPARGVLDGIDATGLDYRSISAVRLGTTLGVNSLLTRSGARAGLITTRGFRDVLEIRRTHRKTLFDLNETFPEPLVPRDLRREVTERIGADGSVVRPLVDDEVREAWRSLRAAGVEAVAIVFLFSFENSAHEQRAREIIEEEGGADKIFASSEVLPTYREYERTSTTVATACIAVTVENYLQGLGRELTARGLGDGRLSIMTNSGGGLSSSTVAKLPVSTLLSGPVGGVEAARWIAGREGWDNVLTMDMGGTSCDVSGIVDGEPDERIDMEIGGHTISHPTYDIETIGAGGGSIAWIDSGGTLRVGPRSAGSFPGPACYGRGGIEPTVTDANLVLGRYDTNAALGGSVELDLDRARTAVADHIAKPLGLGVEESAAGILRIVNILMTNAVRMISVERGRDVRDFTLVAYGGAGPTHAAEIAQELSIPRVLIPPFPGCNSAFGAVTCGSRRDFLRTVGRRIDRIDMAALAARNHELRGQAAAGLREEQFTSEGQTLETWFDIRYEGQAYELAIKHAEADVDEESLGRCVKEFHDLHRQLYGHAFTDVTVEIVNIRAKGFGRRPDLELWWEFQDEDGGSAGALADARPVYFREAGGPVPTRVVMRKDIQPGSRIDGPAVIHQVDSTVLVPPQTIAEALPGGSISLVREDHATAPPDPGDARERAVTEAVR